MADRQLTDAEVRAQYQQRYKQVTGRDSTETDWKQASDYFGYQGQGGLQSQIDSAFNTLEANYRKQMGQQTPAPQNASGTVAPRQVAPRVPAGGGGAAPSGGGGGSSIVGGGAQGISIPSMDGLNSMIGGGTEGGGGGVEMMQPPGGVREGLGKRIYPMESSALAGLRRIY